MSDHIRRARWALTVVFAADGMVFASWSSRLPQIQQTVHADNGALGIALLGTAIGALVAMPTAGWICRFTRPRTVALCALTTLGGAVMLPGFALSTGTLLLALLAFGAAYGSVDVSMNAAAVDIADAVERPILPTFHAAYSLGGLFGAGVGSIVAALDVPVEAHLACVGVVTLGCAAAALPSLRRWHEPVHVTSRSERPEPATGVLRRTVPLLLVAAVLTFGAAVGESSTASWAGIHLIQNAHAPAGLAPLAFAGFSLAQAIARAGGTWLTERYGPRRVVASGAVIAACGLALALIPSAVPALGAYLIVGIGLSNIFPLGTAYAGQTSGSVGVSVSSSVGYAGVLLGPPLVGLVAGATTLTLALTIPVVLTLVVLAVSTRLPSTPSATLRACP